MADHTCNFAQHATLTAGAQDKVTFSKPRSSVSVTNRSTSGTLYVRPDFVGIGDIAAELEDESFSVPPGQTKSLSFEYAVSVIRIFSAGAVAYSVEAL